MSDDGEEVALAEGMEATNPDGEPLGNLSALLIEEGEEEAEFLLLGTRGVDRLVPFEAVMGVDDGRLVLAIPMENVERFPKLAPNAEPSEKDMDLAYEVFDEGADAYADDEDDD